MTSENESLSFESKYSTAGPVPRELLPLANELNSICTSGGKIYLEPLPELFLPPIVTDLHGTKRYFSDFLPKYGSPSPFHPVCCSVKSVV